jgi:hypothetical protein
MTDTRTIELWIDMLNAVWAVDAGSGRKVQTPKCSTKNEFPEALVNLSDVPVALSWPLTVNALYGASGSSVPTRLMWAGETEIHLTADLKKTNLAYILPFFGRLLAAAKANRDLLGTGRVEFELAENESMALVSNMQYGNEAQHHGIVIRWTVVETLSGQI